MRCKAKARRSGEQCAKHAVRGATVCRSHGAGAIQVRRRAAARVAEQQAMEALDRQGVQPIGNPLEALQALAGEILATKDWLARRVEVLEELRYRGMAGEQVRGELLAYEKALDRSIRVLESIAKLDIDTRLAKIDEAQSREYAEMIFKLALAAFQFVFGTDREDAPEVLLCREAMAYILRHADTQAQREAGVSRFVIPPPEPPDPLAARLDAFQARLRSVPDLERRLADAECRLAEAERERDDLRSALGRVHAPRAALPAAEPVRPFLEQVEPDEVVVAELVEEPEPPRPFRSPGPPPPRARLVFRARVE